MTKSKYDLFVAECKIVDNGKQRLLSGDRYWVMIEYKGDNYRVSYDVGWDDWYNCITINIKTCPDKLKKRFTKRVIADHIYLFEA